ncbi:MAG: hypothetical protein JST11_17105 [Acidobacteria bacterium]|nr:hypothetical protein [Acidobacteriota bacterium]
MTIEKVSYGGWPNCFRMTNGEVDLVLTSDIGPRVMRYGFVGGQNFFRELEGQMGSSGEPDWVPRGGHRVWIAPEDPVKSYAPDNDRVAVKIEDGVLEATQPVEPLTGIEKKLTLRMAEDGTAVEIVHTLCNASTEPVELAPWALTMMAQGGYGIHGFPPRGTHPQMLAPTNPLVMWAFTDLGDRRWRLSKKYLVLRQDPEDPVPQKLGSWNAKTWGAYLLHGELFVKRYDTVAPPAAYPDFGCSYETFTNADILELETLGPLTRLAPGDSVTHTERWSLHRGVQIDSWSDEELDRVLGPIVG